MVTVGIVNVTKVFGKVTAVEDVTLEVKDKEFMVLLGPSGCGKTTLLRVIAGLESPTSGDVLIGDQVVNNIPPQKRDVAMVFQSYALYPHMKVSDNIATPLKLRGMAKDEIARSVKEVASLLNIEDVLERKPGQLSGGQRQRVALARAIVRRPRVFLMDEPLSNLDAKLRLYMRSELVKLQKRLGTTTIYVTHDQAEAMTMADRITVLKQGKMQQTGTPDSLYSSPANLFVADFIGSPPMNFIDSTVLEKDGRLILDIGVRTLALPRDIEEMVSSRCPSGADLVLGVRPEDLDICDNERENTIPGIIDLVETLGKEVIVDIILEGVPGIIKVDQPQSFRGGRGDSVYVRVNMNRIHLFERSSGRVVV